MYSFLGDILVHVSFGILSLSNSFHPLVLLGPAANCAFLRYYAGTTDEAGQIERYKKHDAVKFQEMELAKTEKNSVWPDVREIANPCVWGLAAFGAALAFAEEVVKGWYEA